MAIIKKEKWYQRQKVVIGEPIYLPKERMNLTQIDEFCKMLRLKEEELKAIYYNKKERKNEYHNHFNCFSVNQQHLSHKSHTTA